MLCYNFTFFCFCIYCFFFIWNHFSVQRRLIIPSDHLIISNILFLEISYVTHLFLKYLNLIATLAAKKSIKVLDKSAHMPAAAKVNEMCQHAYTYFIIKCIYMHTFMHINNQPLAKINRQCRWWRWRWWRWKCQNNSLTQADISNIGVIFRPVKR